jgi:type I restriction enzyme R subunit
VTELGSGQVQDRQKKRLDEIIEALNDLFVGDLTNGDKVSFFEGLRIKRLESEPLREQAAVNTEAQFVNSPALHDEMMRAPMDGDAAHQSMVAQFRNWDAVQAQMLALMLAKGGLWKALQPP